MYKSTFQTKAVRMDDLARAFKKEGFQPIPTGQGVPAEVIRDIVDTNQQMKAAVTSGRAQFVPLEYRAWTNGEDIVDATDWEIREPERTTVDPFVRVMERVPGRTSSVVRRIMEVQLQIDFTKFALSRGANSVLARQCIKDLAVIKGRSPTQLYNQYIDVFLSCWVEAIAAPRPIRTQYVQKQNATKIPARAVVTW